VKYWFNTLLGIALTAAATAVVAWCTRALVERSLCTSDSQQLACTTASSTLWVAIGVCVAIVLPFASAIFMQRTSNPRGTPLGLLALGLMMSAAGGAGMYAGLRGEAGTDPEIIGTIAGGVLLTLGSVIVSFGMIATGRPSGSPRGFGGGTPIPAGYGDVLAKQGFDQLAELLSSLPDAQGRAGGSSRHR
jgi:hypothetical protein